MGSIYLIKEQGQLRFLSSRFSRRLKVITPVKVGLSIRTVNFSLASFFQYKTKVIYDFMHMQITSTDQKLCFELILIFPTSSLAIYLKAE